MKELLILLVAGALFSCSRTPEHPKFDFTTTFEKTEGLETATYTEVIQYYQALAEQFPTISLKTIGTTDSGNPLHVAVLSPTKEFDFNKLQDKSIILINNGIHPGESDGIDASMMLLRDIASETEKIDAMNNVVLAVIPVYNVGGSLNRNSHTRTNQNGPKAYGFRGNARNFDLNRDFVKADTKNAQSFAKIFHKTNPDVFIDNHVSNGADYQYAITHLFTQHNKLGNDLGAFIEERMRPEIEKSLLEKDIPITPYVNVWGNTPERGFSQFFDSPRYSTGYTTLFNTLGMMVETHMLKPYKQRVEQTYELMESMIAFTQTNTSELKELRAKAVENILSKETYPISYTVDREKTSSLNFLGYEGSMIPSEVTTGERLFYDRSKPYTKEIKYYNHFKITQEITIPKAYILQQGWWKVIDRLKENNIVFKVFEKDTTMTVEELHIADFKTRNGAYEGHYLHYNTKVKATQKTYTFKAGDLYIPVDQFGARYIMETLEPAATDSFFNWNYFDPILQQKEGYSSYVFEDLAKEYLATNPELKAEFDKKMEEDEQFAGNSRAQLDYVYKNSLHYEPAHMKLPIYKVY